MSIQPPDAPSAARDHPCWPEYESQMRTVPAVAAVGFDAWLNGVAVAGARHGPRRPFVAAPGDVLPAGWTRSDTHSGDPPQRNELQLAYDPRRHTAVRILGGDPPPSTRGQLADAGFEEVAARPGASMDGAWYVRDRRAAQRRPTLTMARQRP